MTTLPDLLAQRAFAFGQERKITETIGPLFAAERFGGGARAAEIANVVAWELADQATKALAAGAVEQAAALASLGLTIADNIRCLWVLCLASATDDRAARRHFAGQLTDVANRSVSPDRWTAFRFLLQEVLQPGVPSDLTAIVTRDLRRLLNSYPGRSEAAEILASIEAAIGPNDLPSPPMGDAASAAERRRALHRRAISQQVMFDQPDLAIAHCAALSHLAPPTAEDEDRFRAAVAATRATLGVTDFTASDDAALALIATLCVVSPTADLLSPLLRRLSEIGDAPSLAIAVAMTERAPFEPKAAWIEMQYLRVAAELPDEEQDPMRRAARACDAVIAATDRLLEENPSLLDFRLVRCQFLSPHRRHDVILSDLVVLLTEPAKSAVYDFTWKLMKSHWEDGDFETLDAAARLARRAPVEQTAAWMCLSFMCEISDRHRSSRPIEGIMDEACEAIILKTNEMMAQAENPFHLRYQRTFFMMEFNLYRYLIEDFVVLFDELILDKAREKHYASSITNNILYLKINSYIADQERLYRYFIDGDVRNVHLLRNVYLFAAEVGRMDLAYQCAERLAELDSNWNIILLLRRFLDVGAQTPALILEKQRRGKNVIYANIVCWGEEYVHKMAWGSLSSLLSPNNIPLLAENNDIVFHFLTHASNVATIASLPEVRLLNQYCEVQIYCLPDCPNFFKLPTEVRYFLFGHAQHFTMLCAQRDTVDLLLLASDVVNADGCLAFVNRHVSDEPRAMFYDGLNCSLTPVRAALQPYREGSVITVDAKSLAEIAVRNLQPIALNCFFDKSGAAWKEASSILLVRKPFGFRVYSLSQALVYASAAALQGLNGFDCLPVEGRLSALMLEKLAPEQIITRRTTEDFLWIELDDDDRLNLVRWSDRTVSHVDAVVKCFRTDTRHQSRFALFDRVVDCHVDGLEHGDVIDDETEAAFLEELARRRRTDPIFTQLCFESPNAASSVNPWTMEPPTKLFFD